MTATLQRHPRPTTPTAVPIDNTLEFNAQDELGVNIQDVIEHLQERIQYHTASNNYSVIGRGNRWASLSTRPIPQDHHQG